MKRWMIVEFRKQDRQRFHVRRDPPERERRTHGPSHITEPSTGVPESHMVCTNGRANATAASTHPCITEPHSPAAPSASSASAIRRSTEPPCSITAKKTLQVQGHTATAFKLPGPSQAHPCTSINRSSKFFSNTWSRAGQVHGPGRPKARTSFGQGFPPCRPGV